MFKSLLQKSQAFFNVIPVKKLPISLTAPKLLIDNFDFLKKLVKYTAVNKFKNTLNKRVISQATYEDITHATTLILHRKVFEDKDEYLSMFTSFFKFCPNYKLNLYGDIIAVSSTVIISPSQILDNLTNFEEGLVVLREACNKISTNHKELAYVGRMPTLLMIEDNLQELIAFKTLLTNILSELPDLSEVKIEDIIKSIPVVYIGSLNKISLPSFEEFGKKLIITGLDTHDNSSLHKLKDFFCSDKINIKNQHLTDIIVVNMSNHVDETYIFVINNENFRISDILALENVKSIEYGLTSEMLDKLQDIFYIPIVPEDDLLCVGEAGN